MSNPDASPSILLVEDERSIRAFVRASLSGAGYRLEEADTGEKALRLAAQRPPAAVILELRLPDIDGDDGLRRLREWLWAPIIVVSARNQVQHKLAALEAGADDYLTKPFETTDLLSRLKATLQSSVGVPGDSESSTFRSGELTVDLATSRVIVKDSEIHLAPLEYKLLSRSYAVHVEVVG